MDFRTLRAANLRRCTAWHPRGVLDWSVERWAVATVGELGEAFNIIKKMFRAEGGLVGNKPEDTDLQQKLADELADTAIYLDLLAARAGIDLERAIVEKFNRTSEKNTLPVFLECGLISDISDGEETPQAGSSQALLLAIKYGGTDDDHHKAWVIDQMVRALTGDDYARFVEHAKAGEDGPDTYDWDEGIAP